MKFSKIEYSILFLVIAILITYGNSLGNFFTNWDDPGYILINPLIRDVSPSGIARIFTTYYMGNYHPLTAISNAIEFNLFGLNPLPYHFNNLILHIINSVLVLLFINKLSENLSAAIVCSFIFGLHPMHVETVAWLSDRKDLLYSFFYLLALIEYLKYSDNKKRKNFYLCFLFFVLSLLSKSLAVTFPFILIAIDYYRKNKIGLKDFINKGLFFGCSLIFGIVAIFSQQSSHSFSDFGNHFSLLDRMVFGFYGLSFYIIKFFFPSGLSAFHPFPGVVPIEYYFYLLIIPVMLLPLFLIKKYRKELVFGYLFFISSIFFVLQILPVGNAIVAERYSYLAYVGLAFPVGVLTTDFYKLYRQNNRVSLTLMSLGILTTILLMFLSQQRTQIWNNSNTLFSDVIEKYPESSIGYTNRANYFFGINNIEASIDDYSKAIKLNPGDARAYYNRANAFTGVGLVERAIGDYNYSVKLDSSFPDTYNNRGLLYQGMKKYKLAFNDFDKAIYLNGFFEKAYYNRGNLFFILGNDEKALNDFNKVLSINPQNFRAYVARGNILNSGGKYSASLEDYDIAIAGEPENSEAYYNRGIAYYKLNRIEEAIADYKRSIGLNPKYSEVYNNLGICLFLKGNNKEALKAFNTTLELNPNHSMALYNRGCVFHSEGKISMACEDWKKASGFGHPKAAAMLAKNCH